MDALEYDHYYEMVIAAEKVLARIAVEELIKDLPADKDILENGQDIVEAQNAYNVLSEDVKALVSKDSKAKLDQTIAKFKLFTKASVSGLQQAIANVETLDDKVGIVDKVADNLNLVNELGMDESEYEHYYEMIILAEKTLAGPVAAKAVEELIEELPADKDILDNGWDISLTKNAYDKLSEDIKLLVREDSKVKLDQTIEKFKLFTKTEVSGLQQAIANAEGIEEKANIIRNAKSHLGFAFMLGMDESEHEQYEEMIIAAEELIK